MTGQVRKDEPNHRGAMEMEEEKEGVGGGGRRKRIYPRGFKTQSFPGTSQNLS